MMTTEMHYYEVELQEGPGGPKSKLLVQAIDATAAENWARNHAESNGFQLSHGADHVPDVVKWSQKNFSIDAVSQKAERLAAARAKADEQAGGKAGPQ